MDDVVIPWALEALEWHSIAHWLAHSWSLTDSLTHLILINLLIKVKLGNLLLSPLLSITFVPSAFYAYVWHILEGTSKVRTPTASGKDLAPLKAWVL